MATRRTGTARSSPNVRKTAQQSATLEIATLKAKLITVKAVVAKKTVPKIPQLKRIHLRRLIPRVPTGDFHEDAAPTGVLALHAPRDMSVLERGRGMAMPRADTDTIAFERNVQLDDVSTHDAASHVCEPSVAMAGNLVLYTGNWFTARSTDGGQSFDYLDPYHAFPDPPGMGFCCDQVVHYIKKIDTFVWLLQYEANSEGENLQRLAFASAADVQRGNWRLFDITPKSLGLPGLFLDFPDLAVGTNMLYVTTNAYKGRPWDCSIVLRLPLASLKSGNVSATRFVSRDNFNFRVAQNCGTTAYFASHNSNSQVRAYKWGESAARPTFKDVDVASWEEGNYRSLTPDHHNWLTRADGRMTGAALANGELWFAWGANRGGANNRPQPYVQIARIKASNQTLVENINLWDAKSAICYAALATNSNNEVGVSYALGGGSRHVSHIVGVLTGTRREVQTFSGDRGPRDGKWGDYLTVRRAYPKQKLFVATGFTLKAGTGTHDAVPNLTVFGRSSDL